MEEVFQTSRTHRALKALVQERLTPNTLHTYTPGLSEGPDDGPQGRIRQALDIHFRAKVHEIVGERSANSRPERFKQAVGLASVRATQAKAAIRMDKIDPKLFAISKQIHEAAVPVFWQNYTDALIQQIEHDTAKLSELSQDQHLPKSWGWEEPESFPLTVLTSVAQELERLPPSKQKPILRDVPGLYEEVTAHPDEPLYKHLVQVLGETPRFDTEPLTESDAPLREKSTPQTVLEFSKNHPFSISTGPETSTSVDAVNWGEKQVHEDRGRVMIQQTALTEVRSAVGDIERLPPEILAAIGPERHARLIAARDRSSNRCCRPGCGCSCFSSRS